MKRDLIIKAALFCTLAIVAIPDRLAAQGQNDNQGQSQNNGSGHHSQYRLIDLGTLGGPQSYIPEGAGITDARLLNNKGSIIGLADTSNPDPFPDFCWVDDCFAAHAFVGGSKGKKDLGVLIGGASSDTSWIADNGVISGDSQNGKIDPLIPGFPEIHAVLWRDGLIDLGTLEGGNESISMSVNSDAKVVGFALNGVADVNSMVGLGYQARAFLWQDGAMQDLGTLGSGTDAIGALINERGQVVGWSYTSSDPSDICAGVYGFALSTGSFLWEQGKGMTDLGGLGGTCTVAFDLNQRGQVVGQSWLAGDLTGHAFRWDSENGLVDLGTVGGGDFSSARAINNKGQAVGGSYLSGNVQIHAALWTGNTATDLGALDSDQCAYAFSINAVGQVVGASGTTNCESTRAFLWEPGSSMVDLNSLVAPNSNFHLAGAAEINDRGEIAGVGVLPNGDQHAVLLVPCASDDQSGCAKGEEITAGGASLSTVHAPQRSHGISSSNSVRRMFRLRTGLAPHLQRPWCHIQYRCTASLRAIATLAIFRPRRIAR